MAPFKEKAQMFVFGLLIGLVAAGSFFMLKLDDYFQKIKSKASTTTYYLYKDKKEKSSEEKEEIERGNNRKQTDKKSYGEMERAPQTQNKFPKSLAAVVDSTTNAEEAIDTVITSGLNAEEQEEIIMEKEELIASIKVKITNLNVIKNEDVKYDSMLQKVSGIKDDNSKPVKEITAELWKSPLRFKGYKMSKNKLVLYGPDSISLIKIYKLGDKLYLKNLSNVFELEETYDYKPFKKINTPEIIGKLE